VQLCGDAHLSTSGAFASPERRLLFDLNDFDETLPGPFEYDLKRMAASLRAVRSVLPSPDPGLGTFPVLAVLFLGVAVAPSPEG
jgi:uncharacterized protein DUF2252